MKKLISVFLCLILLLLSGCGDDTASSAVSSMPSDDPVTPVEPYKVVIMRQESADVGEKLLASYNTAYNQALSYAKTCGMEYETVDTTEENAVSDMISQAVTGAKTFICIGNIFSSAVTLCSQSYKKLNFVLFDGTIPENELTKNVLQFSFAYDEAGFILGYCLVNSGIRNIGFVADGLGHYESEILKGITAGAGYAANEKNNPVVSTPPTQDTSGSQISSTEQITSSVPSVTQTPGISVTIEKYLFHQIDKETFSTALDIRKDLKNMRLVCIGDEAATQLSAHPGQFYMFTDSEIEYSRKHAQFTIGGEFDILPELEMLSTAGEGWSNTYGGRTVRFSVAQGNILFPVYKLSSAYLTKAKSILAQSSTNLNSSEMKKGFGYVTETEYKVAS